MALFLAMVGLQWKSDSDQVRHHVYPAQVIQLSNLDLQPLAEEDLFVAIVGVPVVGCSDSIPDLLFVHFGLRCEWWGDLRVVSGPGCPDRPPSPVSVLETHLHGPLSGVEPDCQDEC